MDRNIDIDDFPKICRLCLACGNLQPFINLKVLETFSKITSIQVSNDDKLPENVCKSCVRRLDRISEFIQTCSDNDKFLRDVINKSVQKKLSKERQSAENDIKSESSDDEKNADTRADQIFGDIKEEDEDVDQNFVTVNLNKDGPVSCQVCSQVVSSRLGLLDHYKDNPSCRPEEYTDSQNIVKYLDKSESDCKNEDDVEYDGKGPHLKGKKMFLCNFCGKNYTRKNGLDRHILSHTGVKPFECKECGKRYITKDTLKTHILTHTGIKAFKCQLCGKNFTQSSHLSYHMKRHQGERPFVCTYCGKCFVSNYHLERHKLMHTGVKPYQCKQCGKQIQYTEEGLGQCSCIESDIEPMTDIDFEDTSQESSEGSSDIQPDYESNDLEVSPHKSFEFLFEEEEPAALPYKTHCKVSECTDVEYLEDKLDVSEIKIKPDISEQTGSIGLEKTSGPTVKQEFKQETGIIGTLTSGEESRKDISSGEEIKLESKMENILRPSGYDFIQSRNVDVYFKESNQMRQEYEINDTEHEQKFQTKKDVASDEVEDEMESRTDEFGDQTEVKMNLSDCDIGQTSLGEANEVTVHQEMKQESGIKLEDEMREYRRRGKKRRFDFSTWHGKIENKVCRRKNRFNDSTTNLTPQVCEKNMQRNDIDSAVLGAIFQKMPSDSVSLIAMTDPLICDFALEYVKGCNSEIAAMKKMRELAKLLIRVKTFEPSIKNLQDMLKPEHISVIICALKILGRFNETLNKYEKGAPVLSVGTSLKHCCKICIGKAELEDIQGFIGMLNILQKRLPRSISNDSTEGKEIHIKKESPYGECLVKTEPGMAVVNKQTVENECGTNSSGNICAVGGNELSIHHEIKQEEEIINILEKIKIESGSNTIDTNCEDDLVLLGNEINIGYRKVKNYSERPTFYFLCKKDVRHFARHLRIKHSEEPEAKEILSLPVGDKHRKALITKLRKRWNFFGNRANPRPAKILNNKVNKKILPCPNCLGFYTAKFLFRHRKMCDGAKGTRHQAWGQNLLLEHDVDPLLVETVFRRMLPDDVSFVAKNDPLICDFALKSLKTKRSGAIHISQRMRGLAKLIIHTKTFDQSVKGLRDILKPKYFDIIISSLKILAKFNDKLGKYQTGSLVLHIGTSLRNCCKIVIADKSLCSEEVQEVRDMLEILRNKWPLSYEVADKKRKKVPDANKLALEETDKILEKQKVSNIKEKRGIKVRWTEEQKEAVKSFFAEHIKHKKSVKLSDCIDIKNRHPTLLANKDWKKIKSFVQYVCRKMSQGEETKEVSAGEKKLHARAEILRRALHATKGKVDAKKIYENMPGGTEIHEKETVSREEKGSSESEEDCDRDDVDNEKATSYEPEVVQSSNENQSSCSFYSEKRHFCVICNVEVTNLAEHLERNHSQKPELTQILSLPRGGKRKKLVLSKVKEMCIQRQSKTDYDWPANTNCPGFYSATQLVETVLQKMAPDEVTSVARNDLLIRKFALDYLKTHKLGNVSILSRKMRELAELLILSKNSEPSLSNLIDLIKPIHFHVIIDTLKTMGKYDDKLNRLGNSLLVSSVRESLTNCCEIVIKEGKRTPHEVYECIILLDILKTQWPKFVPVSDTKQVAERSKSLLPQEKETLIPWTEEQKKVVKFYFAKHIKLRKEVGEPECLDLKKLYPDLLANKNWKNIKEFVQNKCKRMPKSREVLERKDMSSPEMDKENNSIDVKYNVEDYYDIIEKSSDEELDNMMDASTKSDVYSIKELLSDEDGEEISSGLMEKLHEKKDAAMILENCDPIEEVGDEGQAEDNSNLDEADFEIKQESDIDIVEHEIESEVSPLRRTGTRSKNFCFICKMQVNNFARHLQRRHSQEPELRQIMSLPQGSRRRKLLLTKVRKRWNFLSKEVKGLRSAKAKLVPCTNCLGYYSAKQLFRHRKKCSGGTSDRKHLASGQNLLVTNVVDPFLVETVFSRMRADDISLVAKNDPLICKFALDYLKTHKTNKHGVSAVSRKMRQLANLLMLLRSLEPSIINLRDILKPTYLDVIVRAIKFLGHFDDASGRFKKLILVVSIGWSLKYCCKMIIENEDLNPEEADVYRKMLDILRSDWPKFVSTEEKEVKMTKKHRSRTRVPWTQEQKKVVKLYFAEHIKHRKAVRISECTELKSKYPDLLANKDWRKIKVFVQNVYRKMEKEINHSEKESFSKVIHDKKKVDVGEANVPKASSGGEWDDDKRGFSPRVENSCENRMIPEIRKVYNEQDIVSSERNKENCRINVTSNGEDDYDIKEISSATAIDKKPTDADLCCEEYISDRNGFANGEEISSGVKVLENWKEEFSGKKDVDMVLESCEPIQAEVRPLYYDRAQTEYDSIFEGAEFEIMQENDIIDMVEPDIESEVTTSGRVGKRRRNFCLICKTQVHNFARHLQRRHSQEPELKQIMSLRQGSKQRKLLLTKLRKKWNFLSSEVRGQITSKAKLLPCTNCFGYYSAKQLRRHRKKCTGGTSDTKHQASGQNLLVTNVVDPLLVETVFLRMLADDVALVAKNDPLICKFALHYLKTHNNRVSIVSRKMRELAKFLILLRSLEPSVTNLKDILKPIHFDLIIRAIKILGKFNDASDKFEKGMLVVSIGGALKYCCKISIQSEELSSDEADVFKEMLNVLRFNWPKFVSTTGKGEVKMKLHSNRTRTPWTEEQKEVVKLHFTEHIKYKKSVKEGECTELKSMYPDLLANKDWKKIKVFVQNIYRSIPETEDNHNEEEPFSGMVHDNVAEANLPESSFLEGDGQIELSFTKEKSNEMKEKLTAGNDVHPSRELFSRLEEVNSRVEEILRGDDHERKKMSCRTEESLEEEVDKEVPTNTKGSFSRVTHDDVAEENLPESSCLEGDDQIGLSLPKEKSNEMKEKLTAGNDVHPSRELSSRLEEVTSRVEAILRGDDHERKGISCRTEESLEEEVDNSKDVPTNTDISPAERINNTKKVWNCMNKKKRRLLIPWTDEQKQVVKAFFADHIKRKQAVKEYECSNLKSQYPDLLANKDWKKIKVYVQNLYTNKTK